MRIYPLASPARARLPMLCGEDDMAIQFNHTILSAHDSQASAAFLAEMLGLPAPTKWGPFVVVTTDNGTNLDYMDVDGEIARQHYAFLVSESDFEDIFNRIRGRKLPFGPIPVKRSARRSITAMAGAVSISKIRTAISWRSSPVRTAAAAGIPERRKGPSTRD
jgi:hypothetical protein